MDKTNELYVLDRNLNVIHFSIIDDINPVKDIISPQKTIFEIPINKNVEISNFVYIKDNGKQKYLGIVQDVEEKETTIIYCYPLINAMNIDCVLDNISGNVAEWIIETITKNYVTTIDEENADNYLKIPFNFVNNNVNEELNLNVETNNLFEVLLDIFLKTGVYIDFELDINNKTGKADAINCIINKSSDDITLYLKYDNPLILETPKIELSQAQSLNKIIFVPSDDNTMSFKKYIYYLLEDNTITTNASAVGRIKGVVQNVVSYTDDDYANGLDKIAYDLLVGNSYNHQITITILNNDNYDFQLYKRIVFIGENATYLTYITGINKISDKYSIINLGVLRTKLTDKLKKLNKDNDNFSSKVKQINKSISGVSQNGNAITFTSNSGEKKIINVSGNGEKGDKGDPASVTIGTTTTLEAGNNATVTNSGTSQDAILNFGIPKGDTGNAGTISVGTVTTLDAGNDVTITNTGTPENAILNFGIPKGSTGSQGIQGVGVYDVHYGTPSIEDGKTKTPITFELTNQALHTIYVYAQNGEKGETGDSGVFDTALSTTSTNGVQNKVITQALNSKNQVDLIFNTRTYAKQNHSLISGYKFSDYAMLNFIFYSSSDTKYRTLTITPTAFQTYINYSLNDNTANTGRYMDFSYVNDTTFSIGNNAYVNMQAIYGIRK